MSDNLDARSALSMLADACITEDFPRWVLPRLRAIEAALDERDALKVELDKAKRALESAGYTLLDGAQEWKPPIGPSSSPLLDLIDSLRAELEAARMQADKLNALIVECTVDGDLDSRLFNAYMEYASPVPPVFRNREGADNG
jgi:hypothetical protein